MFVLIVYSTDRVDIVYHVRKKFKIRKRSSHEVRKNCSAFRETNSGSSDWMLIRSLKFQGEAKPTNEIPGIIVIAALVKVKVSNPCRAQVTRMVLVG